MTSPLVLHVSSHKKLTLCDAIVFYTVILLILKIPGLENQFGWFARNDEGYSEILSLKVKTAFSFSCRNKYLRESMDLKLRSAEIITLKAMLEITIGLHYRFV